MLLAKLVEQEVVDKPHLAGAETVAHGVVDVGNGGVIQQLLKLAQVAHAVLLQELRQEAVVLRARKREAVTQDDGEHARQGLGGKLDVLVGFCIGGLEGGNLIELLVGELDKPGGQGKEAIDLR